MFLLTRNQLILHCYVIVLHCYELLCIILHCNAVLVHYSELFYPVMKYSELFCTIMQYYFAILNYILILNCPTLSQQIIKDIGYTPVTQATILGFQFSTLSDMNILNHDQIVLKIAKKINFRNKMLLNDISTVVED